MSVSRLRVNDVLVALAFCSLSFAAPRSPLWAQFSEVAVELTAVAGTHQDSQKATGLPLSLSASAGDGYDYMLDNGLWCSGAAGSRVSIVAKDDSISASISVSSSFGGANRCLPISSDGQIQLTASVTEPVYRTSVVSSPDYGVLDWSEVELARTDDVIRDSAGMGTAHTSFGGAYDVEVLWSLGGPPGSLRKPFALTPAGEGAQSFAGRTPGDLRYYAPTVDATIVQGFELAGVESNPFTAFRFPEVPADADAHFTLKVGATEIAGLAGETVNLRQYAPEGVSALSLRGDFTPFLTSTGPSLTFGLGCSLPGAQV